MSRVKTAAILLILLSNMFAQNRVLFLDGDGDYVDLYQPIINHDVYSMEAWMFMFEDGGGIEQQSTIFSQGTDMTGCYNSKVLFLAMARADLPNSSFGIRTDAGCYERATAPYPGKGTWHHLVGIKTLETVLLYSDGQLIATTPITQHGSFASNIDYVNIGRHQHDGQSFGLFYGLLDEIRVWDYALTQSEINTRMHVELTGSEQGLIAYWNFNNNDAVDMSGNGNDGSLEGDATTIYAEIPVPQNIGLGDLNQDGQIDISDVVILINNILGSW